MNRRKDNKLGSSIIRTGAYTQNKKYTISIIQQKAACILFSLFIFFIIFFPLLFFLHQFSPPLSPLSPRSFYPNT